SLEKIGAGTVNLSVAQTYNGDTTVSVGALNVSAALTTTGKLTVARDASMTFSAAGTFTQLSGEGTINLGSTGSLTLSNSGDEKFSNWTGTIKVGANTGVNGTQSANWNCAGATVEFSGTKGWLYGWNGADNSVFAANITLVGNGFTWNNGTTAGGDNPVATLTGKLTGSGSFIRDSGSYNQSFVFAGDVSGFTGTFTHTASLNYATLTFGGKTDAIEGISAAEGSVTGTSTINWYQGTLTSSQDKRVYFNYSNDVRSDSRITGAILVKQGAGSLTLTQANSYSGGTTVEAGTLIAGNASALGTGAVTVNSGAKLQVKAGMNVSVSTADSTTVTLASGAKLVVDFADVALPAGAQEQTFQIMTAAVFSVYGTELSEGDVTSSMSGAWELLNGDDAWLDSAKWTLAGNTLSLTMTIPEPSVFGLLAGLGALALAGTRRRRRKA
ncbi:MAG: autotransporter-associated beta strand repeat-containing protein, partial [Candidatus Spyradosoma sp.]